VGIVRRGHRDRHGRTRYDLGRGSDPKTEGILAWLEAGSTRILLPRTLGVRCGLTLSAAFQALDLGDASSSLAVRPATCWRRARFSASKAL